MGIKATFTGRLGANVNVITTQNAPFISLSVAVNDRVGKENCTTWLTVTGDYNRFKNIVQYLVQGKVVTVCGSETCSTYTTKNNTVGIDRKVVADYIEFVNLGKKQDDNTTSVTNTEATQVTNHQEITTGLLHSAMNQPQPQTVAAQSVSSMDNDLPF